jgi:hypothetical protein
MGLRAVMAVFGGFAAAGRACLCAAAAALLAHGTAAAVDARPDTPLLANAIAVLRVGDGLWLDRQVAQFATAAGEDPQAARDRLGSQLYLCNDIAAVDLQRPALRAWRSGADPLVAIIPVADRRAFIERFGITPPGEPPLVRTGDHEGTVVFTRTLLDHTEEYHLLIDEQTAYFAHSVEDCRALAAKPLRLSGDDVALSYTAWGPFTDQIALGIPIELPSPLAIAPPALKAIAELTRTHVLAAITPQVAEWRWQVHERPAAALITGTLEAVPDSNFAKWLGTQAKQPFAQGEALPATCLARVDCAPLWQGQCDAFGAGLIADAKAAAGAGWTPSLEEVWHGLWTAGDGLGPLAAGVALPAAGSPQWVAAMDSPQPDVTADQLGALLMGWQQQSPPANAPAHQAVISVAGACAAVASSPHAVVLAFGATEKAQPLALACTTAPAQADQAIPDAAGATTGWLACLRIDGTRVLRVVEAEHLDSDAVLPDVALFAWALATPDCLTVNAQVPLGEIDALLSKVSWK